MILNESKGCFKQIAVSAEFSFQNCGHKSKFLERFLEMLKIKLTRTYVFLALKLPSTVVKKSIPKLIKLVFKRQGFELWKVYIYSLFAIHQFY